MPTTFIPFRPDLKNKAKENRNNPTRAESKIIRYKNSEILNNLTSVFDDLCVKIKTRKKNSVYN